METLLIILLGDASAARPVLIDGLRNGQTGKAFAIPEGTYTIALEGPADYRPSSVQVEVVGTNPQQPMVVMFEKK